MVRILLLSLCSTFAWASDRHVVRSLTPCLESASVAAERVNLCMREVMWPNGREGELDPVVQPSDAALVCRVARLESAGRVAAGCVRALLYERSGLGARRASIDPGSATQACRYVSNEHAAATIERCMLGMMYDRDGLGYNRTEVNAQTAAYACQGTVAPFPLDPYHPLARLSCAPPAGEEAARFVKDCVKGLMYDRQGMGTRRKEISAEVAAFACQGAISPFP